MQIKIADISDIHFGVSPLLTRIFLENLRTYFIQPLIDIKPDIIVITGDYWDKGLQLDSFESEAGMTFMKELVKAFPTTYILILRGTKSHDRKQLNVFNIFKNEKYRIYNEVTVDDILGMHILFIPEENVPVSYYNDYLKQDNHYDWIFFHGMFDFAGGYASESASRNKTVFRASMFEPIVSGKVTGGHIHIKCSDKNCEYTGSFDRFRHGEEESKGFVLYTYDTDTHTCIDRTFYENKGALLFKTVNYTDLKGLSIDELIVKMDELSKSVYSLRIKIGKNDTIEQTDLDNIISITMRYPNIILLKESRVKTKSIEENEQQKQQSEERKKRISDYQNLSFEEITIKYAKDTYNGIITEKDINDTLT